MYRNGTWYLQQSSQGFTAFQWGIASDIPAPADYDGDGKADIAVWRGSDTNWYVIRSSDGQFYAKAWGSSEPPYNDVPVPGDYDGDGKTDIAVWRPLDGVWYVIRSSNATFLIKQLGQNGDMPVPAVTVRR